MTNNRVTAVLAVIATMMSAKAFGANDAKVVQEDAWALVQEASDGYRAGSFLVQPAAAVSGVYDSNIFATRNHEVEDSILVFSPGLDVDSVWERHKLDLDLGGAFGRYSSHDNEDYDDYWANLDGRYDFTDNSNIFGGLGYSHEHEDRGSPENDQSGNEPTTFDSSRLHAGVSHGWGKTTLRLGGTYEALDFDDAGFLSNKDRNRDMTGTGARLSYELHPQYSVYGQGVWDKRDYDERTDDNGFQRDSDGYRADVGVLATFSNRLTGGAYLGYLNQDYDDPRFSDVSAPDFGASLDWRAAPRTTVSVELERSLEETTLASSSGYLYTSLSGIVQHKFTPRMNISAGVSVAEADYQDVDRNDEYYSAEFGMRYYLDPRWYLGAEYRVLMRNSDTREDASNPASPQELDDYGRNQFFLTLGTLLYPVKSGAYWDMPSGETLNLAEMQWPGFYAGAQLGHDTLNLHARGGRDQGTDVSEYSNSDASAGLFAGYGITRNRWYAGLEGEYEDSRANIYHRKSKASSRTLEVDKDGSYGIALRAGYRLATGPLLYGRLGAVETDFDAYTTVNDRTAFADDDDHTETGVRLGLGSDIPVSDHLFVRLDYTYTDYDDFDVSIVDSKDQPQTERFSPREDLFRIGLGWQFGGLGSTRPKQEVNYTGLYAGTHIGHGAVQSDATGIHNKQDKDTLELITSDFSGDFGDDSAATGGVFIGYGFTRNRFYVGLEGELEDSNAEWDHERSPRGRDFSVEKMDTWGISLRGGYVLDNGSLLYARVGKARTRFNTTWVKGENRISDVDRDDTVSGTRLGVGAELPISRRAFARLDYSYTDYDSYDFVTSHGNADSMKFDNSETLFRLGLGIRL